MSQQFDTLRIHAGYDSKDHNNSIAVPIYQTTAFNLLSTDRADSLFSFSEPEPIYTRVGNPTVDVLEKRLAALHGAPAAIALASGIAAVSYSLLNVAAGGGRIVSNVRLYGGSVDAFTTIFPSLGVNIDIVENPDNLEEYRAAIGPDTKAIFIESISNPFSNVADIEGIANIAHEAGIPLIVDNTLATPYLLNPIEYGADVVVYSATKGIGGHGNVIAGAVVESGKFDYASGKFPQFEQTHYYLRDGNDNPRSILQVFPELPFTGRLRAVFLNYLGAALSPFDAYLVLLGIDTLSERIAKEAASARTIIEYLEGSEHVEWVKHPAATGSEYKELADKYLPDGAPGIFGFGFKGTDAQKRQFIEAVEIFGYQANIADVRSLIVNPTETTHGELPPDVQELAGLKKNTIRLSIGLEDPQDLIADLEQAFQKVFG